jgi:hypothetical protein
MALPHITIPPARSHFGYGVGATAQSQFVIPFAFFQPSDITVEIPTGSGHFLILNTEYFVFPTAGFSYGFPGGVVALATPVSNTSVSIRRTLPFQRVTDFPDSGPIQTGVLNLEFDKLVAMIQQLSTTDFETDLRLDALELGDPRIGRALLFPVGDPVNHSLPVIGARADQLLGFRFDGEIQMRSAITVPDAVRNMELPLAASRANRVLGFDAVGAINLVDVTPPAQIIPNAGNIDYRPFDSGLIRSVQERLRERISIKDFGTGVGEGNQAADDAALLAAVNYINAQTSTTALTLHYPDGTYFHGPCPQALTRSRFTITGESPSGTVIYFLGPGTWLQVHGPVATQALLDRVAIGNLHIEGGASAGAFVILSLRRTFGVLVQNISFTGMDTLVDLGVKQDDTQGAYRTTLRDISGQSRNQGQPLVNINWVSGLTVTNVNAEVASGGPSAVAGTNGIQVQALGFSTRVMITNTVLDGYDKAISIVSENNVTSSDWAVSASSLTNCKTNAVTLSNNTGGYIQGVRVSDCWLDCSDGNTVEVVGLPGTTQDGHIFTGNRFNRGGLANFVLGLRSYNVTLSCNQFGQSDLVGPSAAAINIQGGAGGISVCDNSSIHPGDPNVADWGIQFDALSTDYQCSLNRMVGITGSIRAIADTNLDKTRRIHNNSHATEPGGYAEAIVRLTLDVNGDYLNTTPFVQMVQVTGGQVSSVFINNVEYEQAQQTAADQFRGDYILQPGDALRVVNTVTPIVTMRQLA